MSNCPEITVWPPPNPPSLNDDTSSVVVTDRSQPKCEPSCCSDKLGGPMEPCNTGCGCGGGGGGGGSPQPPTTPACCQEILIEREPCRARYLNVRFTSDQTCTYGWVYSSDRTFIFGEITIDEWHVGNFWHRFPVNRTFLFRIPCSWMTYPTWANTGPGGTAFDWFPLPSYLCPGDPGQPRMPQGGGGGGGGGGGINWPPPDYGDRTPYIWDTPWYPAPGGGDAGLWSPRSAPSPSVNYFKNVIPPFVSPLAVTGFDAVMPSSLQSLVETITPPPASGWWNYGTVSSTISATTHNFAPGNAALLLLQTDGTGAKTITGLAMSQIDGQEIVIRNIDPMYNILLALDNSSSLAANRFTNPPALGNDTILPGGTAIYKYTAYWNKWLKVR